ncbi:MAG: hypothetical protein LBH12_02030 [Dysgonamonadaceae bacterium]|jgi:hypothetical protein|nr:hypothetical protein [Dysgonamonadaceae bacterium]
MKQTSLILFCCLSFLTSCNEEDKGYGYGEYYVEMAMVQDDFSFLLDNGECVYNTNKAVGFEPGTRTLLTYRYANPPENNEIFILRGQYIPLGRLKFVEKNLISESKNKPVRLESVWTGNHFLNIRFYMEFHSEIHHVSLWADTREKNQNEINIYFLHDSNNDKPGAFKSENISFDLKEALGEPDGSKTLAVHIVSSNYGEKTYTFNY